MADKPDFNILISPDSKLLLEKISALEKDFPPRGGAWQRATFWGDEPFDDNLWNSLRQQGLFATQDSIVLRRANEWNAAAWKTLANVLRQPVGGIWPFICLEVEYEKKKFKIPAHIQKNPCFVYAQKKGWIWGQPPLAGITLRKYIEKILAQNHLKTDEVTMDMLRDNLPPNASAIENEIKKLSLMSKDGAITRNLLDMQPIASENNAFLLINKLQRGDLTGAWKEIAAPGQSNVLFLLVAVLSRELRILWQLLEGERPAMNPGDMDFKKSLASKMGRSELAKGFAMLADAEWQVKSGRQTPEQTLEFLLVQTLYLFSGKNFP